MIHISEYSVTLLVGVIKKHTENHLKNDYASIFNLYLESMNGEKKHGF
jgi:hypothetical protein